MNRQPARDVELPDYLEIGTQEVYEDPGSTLPQDLFTLNRPHDSAAQSKTQMLGGDTLPPDQSDHPKADTVRDGINSQQTQAIFAGHGAKGRLKHDGPLPKRVLVVDDDLTARLYMRARLMLRGNVQIFEASNVAEALNLFKTLTQIDAALLDVDMGAQNGFELCKSIRSWVRSQGGKQPTIYMITSRSSMLDKMRAKMAGADAFVSKPPSPKEIKSLLAQL